MYKSSCEIFDSHYIAKDFLGGTVVKNPPAKTGDARDMGLIPRQGRSPVVGNVSPLQYSWLAIIPWKEEPSGLWSMRLQRVGHEWVHTHTHTYYQIFKVTYEFHHYSQFTREEIEVHWWNPMSRVQQRLPSRTAIQTKQSDSSPAHFTSHMWLCISNV